MDTEEKKLLPPPDALMQYEQVIPGAAQKFLDETHVEAEHRRSMEIMRLREELELARRGQILAFCLAIICLAVSFWVIYIGYDFGGLAALLTSIIAFAAVFIYVNKRK